MAEKLRITLVKSLSLIHIQMCIRDSVKTAQAGTINVYDILKYNTVVASKAAVASIEEVYACLLYTSPA